MKRFVIILIVVVVLFGAVVGAEVFDSAVVGSDKPKETPNTYTLSERQIRILKDANLPTNYEQLTLRQRSAITSIEQFLVHLEETYGERFDYLRYWSGTGSVATESSGDKLEAVSEDGTVITVWRTYQDGEFVYVDNRAEALAASQYAEEVLDFVHGLNIDGIATARVYVELRGLVEPVDESRPLVGQAGALVYLFISDECGVDGFEAAIDAYAEWIRSAGSPLGSYTRFQFIDRIGLDDVTADNYSSAYIEDYVLESKDCDCTPQGDIRFYG